VTSCCSTGPDRHAGRARKSLSADTAPACSTANVHSLWTRRFLAFVTGAGMIPHIPVWDINMLAEAHLIRRPGTVADVAQAALYLASDNSFFPGVNERKRDRQGDPPSAQVEAYRRYGGDALEDTLIGSRAGPFASICQWRAGPIRRRHDALRAGSLSRGGGMRALSAA
jgi:hypothetical protein